MSATKISVRAQITASATCPLCQKTLQICSTVEEDALTTGNVTQKASYHAMALREQLGSVLSARLWDSEMCGRCRIQRNEKATKLDCEHEVPVPLDPSALKANAANTERSRKDIKLGVRPLHQASCDECSEHAFTRWYADHGTKNESVAYTLCKQHNGEMLARNRKERIRLGLTSEETVARPQGVEP